MLPSLHFPIINSYCASPTRIISYCFPWKFIRERKRKERKRNNTRHNNHRISRISLQVIRENCNDGQLQKMYLKGQLNKVIFDLGWMYIIGGGRGGVGGGRGGRREEREELFGCGWWRERKKGEINKKRKGQKTKKRCIPWTSKVSGALTTWNACQGYISISLCLMDAPSARTYSLTQHRVLGAIQGCLITSQANKYLNSS